MAYRFLCSLDTEELPVDDLATIFSLHNWPGHVSYVIIAISYWLTDIFWLRSMAIVGLSLEILYFLFSGGDLRTGIGWDTIFIGINAYQLYRLWKEQLSLHLPEADRDLLHSVLPGLNDVQIARLLLAGEFSERHDLRARDLAFGKGQFRRRNCFSD